MQRWLAVPLAVLVLLLSAATWQAQQCANPSMVWPSCTPRGNAFLTPGGGGDRAPEDDTLLGTISRVIGGIL